MLGVGDSLFVI